MLPLHDAKYQELTRLLMEGSQVFVICGDHGVGKKTLVRRVFAQFDENVVLSEFQKFDISDARLLKQLSIRKSPIIRAFLIDGDNAQESAYNAALKLFEEPPPDVIFIIAASRPPLTTIMSRSKCILIPPLSDEELRKALKFKGMSDTTVEAVYMYAHGSVSEALKVYERFEEKRRLISFIKALRDRDFQFVLKQVKTIDSYDIVLMSELADDVLLSRYGLIQQDISSIIMADPDFLIKLREALRPNSSPAINWMRAWYMTGV